MFRRFSVNFALFSMGLDALLVCLSLAAATYVRPYLSVLPFAKEYPFYQPTPWLVYAVFAFEWVAILMLFSVYDGRRNLRQVDELISLTLASLLAAVASAGTLYLSYRDVSRLLFIVFVLLAFSSMFGWRLLVRLTFRHSQVQAENLRQVLIVGSGPAGRQLQEQIEKNPHLGLRVAGFLEDNPKEGDAGTSILGTIADVEKIIQERKIDDVVIALPQSAYRRMNQLIGTLHRLAVKVWVIPDYFRLALHKAAIDVFAGIPMLDLRAPALNEYQRMIKRAFDLLICCLCLPIALPLMGVIALAIRLESPGAAIFRQQRVGENGRLFEMLKFRTMQVGAEYLQEKINRIDEEGNIIHKTMDDPRITPLGRFLRRSSLDEIPQIINVLKGDMSLVGPRPELPYLVAQYKPWQRQRFAVPQGITGWWQIHGRSDKPMHLHTEDDIYYVQNYSLLLDIYILMKTVSVIISGKGAF